MIANLSSVQQNYQVSTRQNSNSVVSFGQHSMTEAGMVAFAVDQQIKAAEKKLDLETPVDWRKPDYKKLGGHEGRALMVKRLGEFVDKVVTLVYRDELTGLYNKRKYNEDRVKLFINACKRQRPLSIISLDLDKFKNFNDTYGHIEGDVALKVFADTFKETLGKAGKAYRVGGEELIGLLPNKGEEAAGQISEKIRKNLETKSISLNQKGKLSAPLTVSIGHSTLYPTADMKNAHDVYKNKDRRPGSFREKFKPFETVEREADDNLYAAKYSGRNRVVGSNTNISCLNKIA